MTSWKLKIMAISVLMVCCMIAAPIQGAIVANTPSYSSGDYWNYTASGSANVGDSEKVSVGTGTTTFNGISCLEYKVQLMTKSGSTMVSINTSMYARASDMAMAGTYTDMSSTGMTLKVTVTFNPPENTFKYPMKKGDTWTASTRQMSKTEMKFLGMSSTTYTNTTLSTTYTVVSEESVTVTAGTFDTLKISATEGSNTTFYWYSPKVGNYVKVGNTAGSDTMQLQAYTFKNAPSGGGGGNNNNGGMLGGMMMYLIVVIIIIVVVVVVVVMMMKKKKAQPMAPGQPIMQPAQPGAPTTQAPPAQAPLQQPQYQQPAQQPQYQQPAQQYQQPTQPAYDPNQYQQPPQAQQAYDPSQYQQPPQAPAYNPQQYQQPPQQ